MPDESTAIPSHEPKGKKRVGRRGWASDDQEEFLVILVLQHKAAQATKTFKEFWAKMHSDWIAKWPIADLTVEEIAAGVKVEDKRADELKVSWHDPPHAKMLTDS